MSKKVMKLFSEKLNMTMGRELTPLFSEAKIYIMYTGTNVNGSVFTKEVVEKNMKTLANVPIIGEFTHEKDNFKGHGGRLVLDEDGIEYQITTNAVGLIPESATLSWTTVLDEKEIEREYLVVDGALIWNRDEQIVEALKRDNFGQSMEITITDFDFDDKGLLEVKDFYFTALCILGVEKDGEGYVEPAFKDAKIITYSADEMMSDFEKMKKDISEAFGIKDLEESKKKEEEKLKKEFKETLDKYGLDEVTFAELGLGELSSFESAETLDKAIEKVYNDVEAGKSDEGEAKTDKTVAEVTEEFEAKIAEFESQLKEMTTANEALATENKALEVANADYKEQFGKATADLHAQQVGEVLDKHSKTFEGLDQHISDMSENPEKYSLEEIDAKVYELVGRHSLSRREDSKKEQKEDFGKKTKKVNLLDEDVDTGSGESSPEYEKFFKRNNK